MYIAVKLPHNQTYPGKIQDQTLPYDTFIITDESLEDVFPRYVVQTYVHARPGESSIAQPGPFIEQKYLQDTGEINRLLALAAVRPEFPTQFFRFIDGTVCAR
jgi:hypothetical protein